MCLNVEKREGGLNSYNRGMQNFADFMDVVEVADLRFSGNLLTWWDSNKNYPKLRKLDRILVNEAWLTDYRMSRAHFPPRGISDHCPAFVYLGIESEKVYKPFQIFKHIVCHSRFFSVVEEAWKDAILGDLWFILTSKLKRTKVALKKTELEGGKSAFEGFRGS